MIHFHRPAPAGMGAGEMPKRTQSAALSVGDMGSIEATGLAPERGLGEDGEVRCVEYESPTAIQTPADAAGQMSLGGRHG
jgi:hypothetical protein